MKNTSPVDLPDDMIFSLDIGTRSCVGIISQKNDDFYSIVDSEIIEHPERAMYDGQIHDIDMVVKVVTKIVSALEERNQWKLKSVAIAAAGRSLKTQKVKALRDIDDTREISKDLMDSIEMEGVQLAQEELLLKEKIVTKYYCVGYSVINYFLDDGVIGNPKGHKGSKLEVEIIATFLPHIVVDSLYTVMSKAGLSVMNLTLEPIAAINIAIPQNLRLLNLALIDVGAGTSDIAMTKNGAIVAYGMVSMAGDKITEFLAKEYLLDFREAERLKIALSKNEEVEFTDVIGIYHSEKAETITEKLCPIIEEITNEIAEVITNLNEKAPSAVFCIGGGCQIPKFTECLSKSLDMQATRVVIKGTNMLDGINFSKEKLDGPEFVTPIGIGYIAFSEKDKDFVQITVNDKPIRLFNSKQLTVSDSLVLVGYNARNLISSRGDALKFLSNGVEKKFYGDYGESAKIYVNGVLSSLDTKIKNKDSIFVEKAIPGKSKKLTVNEFLNLPREISYENKKYKIISDIKINEKLCKEDYVIQNNDNLTFLEINTVEKLKRHYGLDIKRPVVNGKAREMKFSINSGDIIENKKEIIKEEPKKEVKFEYNKNFESKKKDVKKQELKDYIFYVNGETVKVEGIEKQLIFVDIFSYIDFDLSVAKGIVELKLNGQRASYSAILNSGDNIEIGWK